MSEWFPIETAPSDAFLPFLVAIKDDDGSYEILRAWRDDDGKILDATYDPFRDVCEDATHWMPIPDRPEQ